MNHRISIVFFTLYVLIHDPAGDRVAAFDGMSQGTVTQLLSGGSAFEFITAQAYEQYVVSMQPAPLTAAQLIAAIRLDAANSLDYGMNGDLALQRAILLTLLDQINTIRSKLPTPLAAITPAQARTAVKNNLESGAAD